MATKFEVLLNARINTQDTTDISNDLKTLEGKLNLNVGLKTDTKALENLTDSIKGISDATKNAQTHTQSFGDIVDKFSRWQIVGDIIHGTRNAISDMIEKVFDLDESLTELSKVTDLSGDSLKSFEQDAFDVGEQIGATGKDVIDATTIFAQAGYDIKDALDLGEQAVVLQNVSEAGATAAGSAQTLISTLKGFKDESLSATHVVDSLNKVSNHYAVTVNDLSTGVKKASAAMAANGTTFEQMVGLITAGTEVMQQPGKIANALSTISARLTAENDSYIASITKGEGVIDKQTGELRSTYDILKDLATVYPNLTSVEKQELVETVAGKTQKTALTSILSNFNAAIGATEQALNSEGSATEENNKRKESLEGRLRSLQNVWQKLSTDTVNSDFIKSLLSIATGFLKITDAVGGLIPILGALTPLVAVLKTGNIIQGISKLAKNFSDFKNNIKGLGGGLKAFELALSGVKAEEDGVALASSSMATAVSTATLSISAILAVISIGVGIFNAIKESEEESRKAAIEAVNTSKDTITTKQKELEQYSRELKSLDDEKKAKESAGVASSNYKSNINEEIETKKRNIVTTQEEIDKEKLLVQAKIGQLSISKRGFGDRTAHLDSYTDEQGDYATQFNKDIKDAGNNLVKYRNVISNTIAKIQGFKNSEGEAGKNTVLYTNQIEELTKYLKDTDEQYNKNKENAQAYYKALLTGIKLTDDQKEAVQDYLNISDEQYSQAEKGIDIQTDSNNATDLATTAYDNATKAAETYKSALDANINTLASYSSQMSILTQAQNDIANSGTLAADTFKQLSDNNLLQYLELVNGNLSINIKAFEDSANATKQQAINNLQASAAQQIYAIMVGDLNGQFKDLNSQEIQSTTTTANASNTAGKAVQNYRTLFDTINYGSKSYEAFYKAQAGEDVTVPQYQDLSAQAQGAIQNVIAQTQAAAEAIDKISLKSSSSLKSGSSSKSASAKQEAEYKATVDSLYRYTNALDIAKNEVKALEDTIKSTDSYEKQKEYIQNLINALQNQINKTRELKNAQSNQIYDYANQLRDLDFSIDYNNEKNELYINNMEHLSDLSGTSAKNAEKVIDEIQKLNTSNVSLDTSVRELTNDISDYNNKLNEIPTEKLKKFNDLLEAFQQSQLKEIQNQIDDLQHSMDNDPRIQALDKEIEALEKENDELDKQQELQEKTLALEKAKLELENQKKQKTLQVYEEGKGFIWETDPEKIKEAQDTVTDAEKDLADAQKNNKIEELKEQEEALKNSYQTQIDDLQKFLDEQNYQIDKSNRESIQSFDELTNAMKKYGLDSSQYLSQATTWLNNYNNAVSELKKNLGIENSTLYSSEIQSIVASSGSNAITSLKNISTTKGIGLKGVSYTTNSNGNNQTINIERIELPNVSNADEFVEALSQLPTLANAQSTDRK